VHRPSVRRLTVILALAFLGAVAAFWSIVRPSNDRDWVPEQAILPLAQIDGEDVLITNVRNSFYRSTTDFDVRFEDRSYDLSELSTVWFVMEPFSDFRGAAHTFLSFGFEGGEYVSISVEIRKERDEAFSMWKGILRQYELMYVIGDERDLIGLRANHRHDDVYVYPMRATPDQARALFLSMLDRTNRLAERPEFYHTLWNNCTTNIIAHVNDLVPETIPKSWKVLFPGASDRLAYELKLIETDLPFEASRERFHVNDRAAMFADDPDFSRRIREE
jgi:hypothetical protein